MKRLIITMILTVVSLQVSFAAEDVESFEGTSWKLVRIKSTNNAEFIPAEETSYLLRFRAEGRLVIESDCNAAGATWVQEADSLQLVDLVTTNKLCQAGSLHNRMISGLLSVNGYTRQGSNLILLTALQGVQLEFELI